MKPWEWCPVKTEAVLVFSRTLHPHCEEKSSRSSRATDANGNPSSQAELYTCPHATEAECLVDVTDQSALDAIAAVAGSKAVNEGTYDTVSLELCTAGKPGGTPAPGSHHADRESRGAFGAGGRERG